jgi:hypothetical protein
LLDDAIDWNARALGARKTVEYTVEAQDGRPLYYACRLNVVPYRGERGVLMVLEDVTERVAARTGRVARRAVSIGAGAYRYSGGQRPVRPGVDE